jgi:cytochrome bd ubiquinol oxidase subunit II
MLIDLVPIWTLILGLAVFYYVVFDGFDLGVGILSGLVSPEWRRLMMNSVAPVWDGNETWLVLGSIGLLAAFPLAFGIIIPAVYFPILIMLLALVFRGVAFEFRFKRRVLQEFWARHFARAPRWRRSPRASSSAPSSRASRSRAATSWEPRSTLPPRLRS